MYVANVADERTIRWQCGLDLFQADVHTSQLCPKDHTLFGKCLFGALTLNTSLVEKGCVAIERQVALASNEQVGKPLAGRRKAELGRARATRKRPRVSLASSNFVQHKRAAPYEPVETGSRRGWPVLQREDHIEPFRASGRVVKRLSFREMPEHQTQVIPGGGLCAHRVVPRRNSVSHCRQRHGEPDLRFGKRRMQAARDSRSDSHRPLVGPTRSGGLSTP
jgi:hypothetical protein